MNENNLERFYSSFSVPLLLLSFCTFLMLLAIHLFTWAQGEAILGSSDYKSDISLGLFWGHYDDRGKTAVDSTIYYEWCSMTSGEKIYDERLCRYKYISQYGIVFAIAFSILSCMSLSYLYHRFISVKGLKYFLSIIVALNALATISLLLGNIFWLLIVLGISKQEKDLQGKAVHTSAGERMAIQVSYSFLLSCLVCTFLAFITSHLFFIVRTFEFDGLLRKNERHLQRKFSDQLLRTTLNSVRRANSSNLKSIKGNSSKNSTNSKSNQNPNELSKPSIQKQERNFYHYQHQQQMETQIYQEPQQNQKQQYHKQQQQCQEQGNQSEQEQNKKQQVEKENDQRRVRNLASLKGRNQTLMEEGKLPVARIL